MRSTTSQPEVLRPAAYFFVWTGYEVRLLREARRMSVREFAAHLGVSDRMVSKWEAGGRGIRPRPVNQQVLDISLQRADPDARERFYAALASHSSAGGQATARTTGDSRSTSHARPDVPLCFESPVSHAEEVESTVSGDPSSNWEIVVPVRVGDNDAVEITAERIATAVGWLPGVQVDGVRVRRCGTGTSP